MAASSAGASDSHERDVVGEGHVLVGEDEEERGGVDGAVVGAVRELAGAHHLAAPELVEDLARLLVARLVEHLALDGWRER